jgi:tetratricopeptide (TPR) repeat protein
MRINRHTCNIFFTNSFAITLIFLIFSCALSAAEKDAEQMFINAMSEVEASVSETSLEKIAAEFKDNYYGQSALLELAKINILKREYKISLKYLKKISDPKITEKEYWMANAYLKSGKNDKAIISAQNFIFKTEDIEKTENAYIIIAEAYINQKVFKRALSTLETLNTSQYINNHIPLVRFKIGYCNEMSGNFEEALRSYKKLKTTFPYHQYTYEAEVRMQVIAGNIDIPEIDDTAVVNHPKTESKSAKGEYDVFLQVGAFSSTNNAENLGKRVMGLGFNFSVFPKNKNGKKLYVVAVGPFEGDNLKPAIARLKENGLDSFVLKR